jgi:hypothetical protein
MLIYSSSRVSIVNNVFAIKNGTCSPNDIHCIPPEEFSDKACKDGFD